jgi:hypothetical protein
VTWNAVGLALSLAVGVLAWLRAGARGGHYDAGVYAMTPAVHRRYALVSAAFALYFAGAWLLHGNVEGVAGLTVYALVVIIYGTSFLRGAEEDEGGKEP